MPSSAQRATDALVAVHARSSLPDFATVTAELDMSFAVNTQATVLVVQAAARVGVRRVVLFTTGVHHDPMPDEIPYVVSKAALQAVTATLAAALALLGATVNSVNPRPNDTDTRPPARESSSNRRCRWPGGGASPRMLPNWSRSSSRTSRAGSPGRRSTPTVAGASADLATCRSGSSHLYQSGRLVWPASPGSPEVPERRRLGRRGSR